MKVLNKTSRKFSAERREILRNLISGPRSMAEFQLNSFDHFITSISKQVCVDDLRETVFEFERSEPAIYIDDNKVEHNISSLVHQIDFLGFNFKKPVFPGTDTPLLPTVALYLNIDYTSEVTLHMRYTCYFRTVGKEDSDEPLPQLLQLEYMTKFCDLPVLVRSSLCNLSQMSDKAMMTLGEDPCNPGGYFITSGLERTFTSHDRISQNFPHITKDEKGNYTCTLKSRVDNDYEPVRRLVISYSANGAITLKPPYFKATKALPFNFVFRLLGIFSEKTMIEMVIGKSRKRDEPLDDISQSLIDGYLIPALKQKTVVVGIELGDEMSMAEVKEKLYMIESHGGTYTRFGVDKGSERQAAFIEDTYRKILRQIFPHVPSPEGKAVYFGQQIIKKLLIAASRGIGMMNRDAYAYKRVETSGILTAMLFKQTLDQTATLIRNDIRSHHSSITPADFKDKVLKDNIIQKVCDANFRKKEILKAFNTGTWKSFGMGETVTRMGTTETLKRKSHLHLLSEVRKIIALTLSKKSMGGAGKAMRDLKPSHMGIICLLETPENENVGLIKHPALTAHITVGKGREEAHATVGEFPKLNQFVEADWGNYYNNYTILINFAPVGFIRKEDAKEFYNYMKSAKWSGKLHPHTSVVFDRQMQEFRINCDSGRLVRPLVIVDDKNRETYTKETYKALKAGRISIDDLFFSPKWRCVEWVDAEEAMFNVTIAPNNGTLESADPRIKRYTHVDIDPQVVLGSSAVVSPCTEFNNALRMLFQAAMVKQAIGPMSLNASNLPLQSKHLLTHPQRQLVGTAGGELVNYPILGGGTVANVAIMTYTGYNQEDSLVVNKASLDRGMFHIKTVKNVVRVLSRGETTTIPDEKYRKERGGSYAHLNRNGIPKIGSVVRQGDVVLGIEQRTPSTSGRPDEKKDKSLEYGEVNPATIVEVFKYHSSSNQTVYRITLEESRVPVIGDKFAAQAGQKGTISIILPEEEMPYTEEGIRPDVILNPHAFPKRMTIGMLTEQVLSACSLKLGKRIDASAFSGIDVEEDVVALMKAVGIEDESCHTMYDGFTGKKMKNKVFMAPCYYQRLGHMPYDKVYARADGPVAGITRQPEQGRRRHGGMKLGVMEGDALTAYGASSTLYDLTVENADKYRAAICASCGFPASPVPGENGGYQCLTCGRSRIIEIDVPFAFLVLQKYMAGAGFGMSFNVEND